MCASPAFFLRRHRGGALAALINPSAQPSGSIAGSIVISVFNEFAI